MAFSWAVEFATGEIGGSVMESSEILKIVGLIGFRLGRDRFKKDTMRSRGTQQHPTENGVPERIFFDLHSHLLPGIDDGCERIEETVACLRELQAAGFVGSVCTPHVCVTQFAENTPAFIEEQLQRWQSIVDREVPGYQLWTGGEVRISDHCISDLQRHDVPTIGPGRCVLIDFFGRHWPDCGWETIEYLQSEGFQPVLAHPERMEFDEAEWDAVIDRLESLGVWLQGNLRCLSGYEGRTALARGMNLLKAKRYRVIATDLHGTHALDERLRGLSAVEATIGEDGLMQLLHHGPKEVLGL